MAVRLSKAGYGRVDEILEMESELVLSMLNFEAFESDYQNAFMEMNRENR